MKTSALIAFIAMVAACSLSVCRGAGSSMTLAETYQERLLSERDPDTGEVWYSVAASLSDTFSASLPLGEAGISNFDEWTLLEISLGDETIFSQVLGDAPGYQPGKRSVTFIDGNNRLVASWTATTLTITASRKEELDAPSDVPHGNIVNYEYPVSVTLGDFELSRSVFLNGKGTSTRVVKGEEEFNLATVNLSGSADFTPPAVTITAPAPNYRTTTDADVTFRGKATDKTGVDIVTYAVSTSPQLTGEEDFVLADYDSSTSEWTALVTPSPGMNYVFVQAEDSSGNVSAPVMRSFRYSQTAQVQVQVVGGGKVTGVTNGQWLEIGTRYTVTAKPDAGQVFANWQTSAASGPVGTDLSYSFVMTEGLELVATFVPLPFLAAKGNYAGLFTNDPPSMNAGAFTATVTDKGSLSAKLTQAWASYSLSGSFSSSGFYSKAIPRKGLSPLLVQLQLDMVSKELITGQVSDGNWTASLRAYRSVYSKSSPAPAGGKKYTLAIMGGANSETQPAGYGYGTVSVDAAGTVSFSGTLGDGTKVTHSTSLSREGLWPLAIAPYSGKGGLLGWLTFADEPESDIHGQVSWYRLPQATAKLYPTGFGFADWLEARGSVYACANGVPVLDWTSGFLELAGGDLPQDLSAQVVLMNNKVTGPNKLNLTLTTTSGLFSGSITGPNGKPLTLNGVVLQKVNAGYGTFLGTHQTGSVFLGSQ